MEVRQRIHSETRVVLQTLTTDYITETSLSGSNNTDFPV